MPMVVRSWKDLGGGKTTMLTFADPQKLFWSIHNAAANKAKISGACWQCCAEAGCRATDAAGLDRRKGIGFRMHPGCMKRLAGPAK